MSEREYENCRICPRDCGADRRKGEGYCGCPPEAVVAASMLHFWEEPVISGTAGSGTVFFSGCSLGCVYCQNREISAGPAGKRTDPEALGKMFLDLQASGAHNVSLVTAAHYLPSVEEALASVRGKLRIPVVYNSGGYETEEAVDRLAPYVDVWLPDLKYFSPELSARYSAAPDYFEVASGAIARMLRHCPRAEISDGIIKKGVIIRHLVLPGCRKDSLKLMDVIAGRFGGALLSLMRQYTPDFAPEGCGLNRRVTSFEYESVLRRAEALGLKGFFQDAESASAAYTPDFGAAVRD